MFNPPPRRLLRLALLALCPALLLSGCGRRGNTVTLAGSTAFQPFAEKLADAYMAETPGASVVVQGGGSALGIESALLGTAEIGMADMVALPANATSLVATVAARDGIVVIVHPQNTCTNLSLDQLRRVFSSEVRNWREVGGPDHAITVVSREAGSGTRSSFEQIVDGIMLPADALIQDSNGTIRETIANDPHAIGYISHGLINDRVQALLIDGQPGTTEAIMAGRYKLVRPIFLLTRGQPTGPTAAFIDYVLSDKGQDMLRRDGLIPAR